LHLKKEFVNYNKKDRYFVLTTNKNLTLEILGDSHFLLGDRNNVETRTEFRLATNLPIEEVTNEEIREIYRQRWQIALL